MTLAKHVWPMQFQLGAQAITIMPAVRVTRTATFPGGVPVAATANHQATPTTSKRQAIDSAGCPIFSRWPAMTSSETLHSSAPTEI